VILLLSTANAAPSQYPSLKILRIREFLHWLAHSFHQTSVLVAFLLLFKYFALGLAH
jgi:hypothetical protein